jgi:hypothetical protein
MSWGIQGAYGMGYPGGRMAWGIQGGSRTAAGCPTCRGRGAALKQPLGRLWQYLRESMDTSFNTPLVIDMITINLWSFSVLIL